MACATSSIAKLLAADSVPKRLPTILDQLKYLELTDLYLMEIDEVSFALCMMTSSPKLIQVIIQLHGKIIDVDTRPVMDLLEVQDYSDISLNEFREVQMLEVSGTLTEFEFIKLMLAKSPKLERMLINPISSVEANRGFNILKEMTRFQRVSPKAEVKYLDNKEKNGPRVRYFQLDHTFRMQSG